MNEERINVPNGTDRDAVDAAVREALSAPTPPEVETRVDRHFRALKDQLEGQNTPAGRREPYRPFRLRFAWAGAGAALSAAAVALVVLLSTPSNLTWAQVVEKFRNIRYFSATVFMTENLAKPPEKIEVWVTRDGRSRLHHRGRVFFGRKSEVLKVFDVGLKREIDFRSLDGRQLHEAGLSDAMRMVRMLGSLEDLSLDEIVKTFSGRKTVSPPLENADASIGDDLQVFDVTNDRTPEWMRIWVLKNSGLPVRLRVWDPRSGDSADVLFDYLKEQSEEAFDPAAFEASLRKQSGRANAIYSLLKDRGGRPLTPQDVFEKTGYHMPELVECGRTDDGVFWVKSTKSRNRTPGGHIFDGFGMLTDDLGQEYLHKPMGHRVQGDLCLEYFIPLDYRTAYEKPKQYTLSCWTQPDHPSRADEVIGSIEVTEWNEGAPVPALFSHAPGKVDALKAVIREWRYMEKWDRFDKLIALIPGEPETDPLALFREQQRLCKLTAMEKDDEAFALTSRLYPLIKRRLAQSLQSHEGIAREHFTQLIQRGRKDEAREVLEACKPILQTGLQNESSRSAQYFISEMAAVMIRSGMTLDEIKEMFGFDILKNPQIAREIKMKTQPAFSRVPMDEDPRFAAWREYAEGIARLYDRRPLPETVDVLTDIEPFAPQQPLPVMPPPDVPLPGRDGCRIMVLTGGWGGLVVSQKPIVVADSLRGRRFNVTCVFRDGLRYGDVREAYLRKLGVEVVETSTTRKVWVARYDGRKLPDWRKVKPLDASRLGSRPTSRGGGTHTTAFGLLKTFERVVNDGKPGSDLTDDKVYIVDETGLPARPGENQTWGSICLTHQYAFWSGDEATDLARDWFEETFGITFHEEMRQLSVLEIRPIAPAAAGD